jgi:hypothetical protein
VPPWNRFLLSPAVPGVPPPIKAICVVPLGMEEGTETDVPGPEFGLVVGVSPARVTQLRHELEASWRAFQEPASVPETGDPRTARV